MSLLSKHVRALQRQIALNAAPPDSYVVGSWKEWHELREEVMEHSKRYGDGLLSADCEAVNFLLCGVPCVAEPVPLEWDGNHILIELP